MVSVALEVGVSVDDVELCSELCVVIWVERVGLLAEKVRSRVDDPLMMIHGGCKRDT